MNRRFTTHAITSVATVLLLLAATPFALAAQPGPAALSAFGAYSAKVESRLAAQHRSAAAFLAIGRSQSASVNQRLHRGELLIEQLTPVDNNLPGAMLHDWRGTAFVPGATAAGFDRLLRDVDSYPRFFSPEVLSAVVTRSGPNHMDASMRVRQQHVITVVLDTAYDVAFAQLDPEHRYSISRSTRISEIASPGTPSEHPISPADDHGFLWRLNTYWSWEQRDGGLYLQIESISLTRSVPRGLGWAVGPCVQAVPRESLEFTLRSARNALQNHAR